VRTFVCEGGQSAGARAIEDNGMPGQLEANRLVAKLFAFQDRMPMIDHRHG
jgi:hypothetical protein